jgi:hypothetical protein
VGVIVSHSLSRVEMSTIFTEIVCLTVRHLKNECMDFIQTFGHS